MGKTLTKSELLREIQDRYPKFRERECSDAAQVIIQEITDALVRGDRIEIRGFGSLGQKYRAARRGRNPQGGSVVEVRPRYTVFFKAGKGLRERVSVGPSADSSFDANASKDEDPT